MNEFTAEKLGEVIAFDRVCIDTITKAKKIFSEFMSEDEMTDTFAKANKQIDSVLAFVSERNMADQVKSVADATSKKISAMRDSYIGDGWDNSMKIFEWWGFFGGGAIAHWNCIKGIAEALEDDTLVSVALGAIGFYENVYDTSTSLLAEIGRNKSL